MADLFSMLRDQENRDRLQELGINPKDADRWLDLRPQYRDPTADEALRNVARWERTRSRTR